MHVQCRLAFPKLRQEGDGRPEVLGTRARVILEIFEVADSGFLGDGFRFLLVLGELGIYSNVSRRRRLFETRHATVIHTNVFGDLRKRQAGVLGPEKVIGRQVIGLFCGSFRWIAGIHGSLDSDAVQLRLWQGSATTFHPSGERNAHLENVKTQALVRPGMRQHGYQVNIAIEDY